MGFNSFATAASMRDAITAITESVVNRMRPEPRIAKVLDINRANYTAQVSMVGDEGSLIARFTPALQPRTIGSIVRISGKPGDYYISDVISEAAYHEIYDVVSDTVDTILVDANQTQEALQEVSTTAQEAQSLASTADGRISISDYDPEPEDAEGRNDGSLWFTRTRARNNLCNNPSAEVNTNFWNGTRCSVARVAAADAPFGSNVFEVTNDGTSGAGQHRVYWQPDGVNYLNVEPGQILTISAFAQLVSGSGANYAIEIVFIDGNGVDLLVVDSLAVNLTVDEYQRMFVTVQAPDLTSVMAVRITSPDTPEVAVDVWRFDGVLVENDEMLGEYFDGDSFDGAWLDTPGLSESVLEGGKIFSIYELLDGGWSQKFLSGSTISSISASQIIGGVLDGLLLAPNSVAITATKVAMIVASEALIAGDIVNVFDSNGDFRVRKACAAVANNKEAHGFVLNSVAAGSLVSVYYQGYNDQLAGLSPGTQFLSTTPGKVTSTPPGSAGQILHRLGFAANDTTLNFIPTNPIHLS